MPTTSASALLEMRASACRASRMRRSTSSRSGAEHPSADGGDAPSILLILRSQPTILNHHRYDCHSAECSSHFSTNTSSKRSDHARRNPDRDQEQRVPSRHHPGRRRRVDPPRSRGAHPGRRRRRFGDLRPRLQGRRRPDRQHRRPGVGRGRPAAEGQGADRGRVRAHAQGPDAVHLPAPGRLQAVHRRPAGVGHHVDRLRDRPDRRRRPAAAGPDERGRRPPVRPGRRLPPDAHATAAAAC